MIISTLYLIFNKGFYMKFSKSIANFKQKFIFNIPKSIRTTSLMEHPENCLLLIINNPTRKCDDNEISAGQLDLR